MNGNPGKGPDNVQDQSTHLFQLGWSSFFQQQLKQDKHLLIPARVTGIGKDCCLVTYDVEAVVVKLAGRFFHDASQSFPVVGDWVLIKENVIVEILKRKNLLSRREAGSRGGKEAQTVIDDQPIAANLDTVFIVCGLDRDYNLRRIERYLALVYNCGLNPTIILTKADLHQDPEDIACQVESVAFGVPVFLVSADKDETIHALRDFLSDGKTAALLGSSGAGKSTLINRLHGSEIRLTKTVSETLGKGRHTTTSRDLIMLPSGGMVVDNPGIREVGLSLTDEQAGSAFQEIEELGRLCRFSDCSHTHEPGCRVLEAVANGEISKGRMKNYQKIVKELSYQNHRKTSGSERLEKERWKEVAKQIKGIKRNKEH